MPTEIRQINFKGEEAMLSIVEYHRRRSLPIPLGSALKISFSDDDDVSATIHLQQADGSRTTMIISGSTLAAALILYCINRKIPLPAESDKRLQRIGEDGVALFIMKRARL